MKHLHKLPVLKETIAKQETLEAIAGRWHNAKFGCQRNMLKNKYKIALKDYREYTGKSYCAGKYNFTNRMDYVNYLCHFNNGNDYEMRGQI
jgi:hypothetical protein